MSFFSQIDGSFSNELAQEIWETHEEKVMQKIYSAIEKNRRKTRHKYK